MKAELEALLDEIDAWARDRGVTLECHVLGGAVLRLFHDVAERTKDLDFVEEPLRDHAAGLMRAFGEESGRRPFLDLVSGGLPVLPQGWRARAVDERRARWSSLRLFRLAPADHVASKLRSFRPHDRRDIRAICRLHPGLRAELAAFTAEDFWTAPDHWELRIEPHRDRVLAWLDGDIDEL